MKTLIVLSTIALIYVAASALDDAKTSIARHHQTQADIINSL
jgi:hypothetical protein